LLVLWNQASISNGFHDIQWQTSRRVYMTLNDTSTTSESEVVSFKVTQHCSISIKHDR